MQRLNTIAVVIFVGGNAWFSLLCGAAEESKSISLFPRGHVGWASSLRGSGIDCDVWVSDSGVLDAQELYRQLDLVGEIRVLDSESEGGKSIDWIKRLAKLDSLVCSDKAWELIEPDERSAVESRLREGMGLVLVSLDGSTALDGFVSSWEETIRPDALNPTFGMPGQAVVVEDNGSWNTYGVEAGRAAVYRGTYRPKTQELVASDAFDGYIPSLMYEYRMASFIRAVLWTSRFETEVKITSIEKASLNVPESSEIPPQLTPEFTQYMMDGRFRTTTQMIAIQLDQPAPREFDVFVRIRQPGRPAVLSNLLDKRIGRGDTNYALHVPVGKGENWVDLWIMRGNDVVDWYSYDTIVEEWPALTDVQYSKWLVGASDSTEVKFSVRKNLYHPTPTYAYFVVSDSYGRELTRRRVAIAEEGGEVRTIVSWIDASTSSIHIEVFLVPDTVNQMSDGSKRISAYASTTLIVEQPSKAGLRWIAEGVSVKEAWANAVNGTLAAMGVNALHVRQSDNEGPGGVEANLSTVGHLDVFDYESATGNSDIARCLVTTKFRQNLYATIQNWDRWAHARGTRHVFLDDDRALFSGHPVPCPSPECMKLLRSQVQVYYPSLERLNSNWGTHFSSWQEVAVPDQYSDSSAVAVDLKRIQNAVGLSAYREAGTQLSRLSRVPKSGLLAIGDPSLGAEVPLGEWIREMSLVSIVPEPLLIEKVRSYAKSDATVGLRLNEQESSTYGRSLWTTLFSGMTTVWSEGVGSDGRISSRAKILEHEVAEIRQGFDVLLQAASRLPASVAIYENAASLYVSTTDERRARIAAQEAAIRSLDALGIAYDFVSYVDLIDSSLSEYGLVLLPLVDALSDEEIVLLRKYAVEGGKIVADGIPGRVDEHGVQNSVAPLTASITAYISLDGDQAAAKLLEVSQDSNGIPDMYPELIGAKKSASSLKWFRFRYGEAELIGMLKRTDGKLQVPAMRFPKGVAVYDTLAGKLLKSDKARPLLNEADAGLIAVLPYRISRIVADIPKFVEAGHRLKFSVAIKTFDALPGDHLVHVRVLDGDGHSIAYYESNIECVDGIGADYIPVALNEKAGRYTLEIRDVMTGITASTRFDIVHDFPNW